MNDNGITIKISGEAGQGIQLIGSALCNIFKRCGCYIFANQDYMSRVRGGNNFIQVRVSDKPIYTLRENSDITVAFDKKSFLLYKKTLNKGIIISDKKKFSITDEFPGFLDVPFYDLAEASGSDMFINTVCCGVILALTGVDFNYLEQVIKESFADKGEEIIGKNISAGKAGFDYIKNNFKDDKFKIKTGIVNQTLLMNGNEAIGLGAIRAGCKFYSAYPMTPSTSIMDTVAHFAKEFNIVVEQAEDEIAAINMVIGASFAGVRAMSATSGGGFCLMVEGLSLAAMTETPVVLVDAQRPAPATGFPTRTEQSDLDFLIHAGHGEFARAVFAPGTIEEAFYLTIKAFNLAEEYQIPVLIMTDQHLADSYRNINSLDLNKVTVKRSIISKEDSKSIGSYQRYQLTPTGISPRAIPSWIEDVIYSDSDEHDEMGHITEDGKLRTEMVKKRFYKKVAGLTQEIEKPTGFNLKDANNILLGFGSTYGVMREVCEVLGSEFGFLHFSQVWPFPVLETVEVLKKNKNIITVENNAGGQLARLLKRETGINADCSILRYDGRPFSLDFVIGQIKQLGYSMPNHL
ncbi:MAG: 2-oxoacid:acceptor oxidoreductase subunit alpha [Candidatus Omnitrophota bacterium]